MTPGKETDKIFQSPLQRPLEGVNLNDERKPILPTSVMLDNTPQDDEDEYVGEDEEEEYDDLELEKA